MRRFLRAASQSRALVGPGDPAARRLAARQHRVISAEQAEVCGLSVKATARRCRSGEWTRLHPGAFLVDTEPPTYPARALAAVLSRAPAVAAAGATAGWLNGMLEREPSEVVITVLDGGNRGPLDGVRIQRPRSFLPDRIHWRQGIPVTSPADTLLDLAASLAPEELETACALALRKHLISRTELQRRIDESPGRPGIAALRAAALRAAARAPQLTRSQYERELRRLVRLAELPSYDPNVVIYGKELDLYWPEAKLGIEVDAYGTHGDRASFEDDRKLDVDFGAAGVEIRRFTGHRITNHPHAVIARIAALLTLKLGGLPPPRRR